jgi:Ca2+-binding RTX toxin-like protein
MPRYLVGTSGNNKFVGLKGVQDFFIGLAGRDTFRGNGGKEDTADYSRDAEAGATHGIVVNLLGNGRQAGLPADTAVDSFGFRDKLVSVPNVVGTEFADRIYGGAHANVLRGGAGNDLVSGHNGNDRIFGDEGSDRVIGGLGADRLYGGTDGDTFVFRKLSDSTAARNGRDTIFDFSQAEGDTISLSALDANRKAGGNQAFTFIENDGFHRKAGELRYETRSGNTIVLGDMNGDGKADFAVALKGIFALTGADFVL